MMDNQSKEFLTALARIHLKRHQQARQQACQSVHRLLDRSPDYNENDRVALRVILDELKTTSFKTNEY